MSTITNIIESKNSKIKLAFATGALGLAIVLAFKNRPTPAPTNAMIIRIVSRNDVDGVRDAISLDSSQLEGEDLDGNTPLHIAARGGFAEMVDALIAAGADVNRPNRAGWTPLASALLSHEKTQAQIIGSLLAAGADPNCSLSDGTSLRQLASGLPGVDRNVFSLIARDASGAGQAQTTGVHLGSAYASTADARK